MPALLAGDHRVFGAETFINVPPLGTAYSLLVIHSSIVRPAVTLGREPSARKVQRWVREMLQMTEPQLMEFSLSLCWRWPLAWTTVLKKYNEAKVRERQRLRSRESRVARAKAVAKAKARPRRNLAIPRFFVVLPIPAVAAPVVAAPVVAPPAAVGLPDDEADDVDSDMDGPLFVE